MSDHDNDVNQVQDNEQGFRTKVARALSKAGTVDELKAHPDDAMTLHLNEDEAVVMQGEDLDFWLAEEENNKAFFEALDERKREDLQKADDFKQEDAARERDMASTYDEADADIGEFSLGEDRPSRAMSQEDAAINKKVWDQYKQKANQEQDRQQDVEPYDQTKVGDSRLYDIRGNVVTAQQIDDIMRSRAELKQHLDDSRRAAQQANGYDRDAVRQKDQEQANTTQTDYYQAVAKDANTQTGQEAAPSKSTSSPSRGDLVRARAAQFAAEPEEQVKRTQEQKQSR